ncbi:MAG: hypothetical protein COV01_02000 [Candidatus Taylorbacteria bacterium CG10_big_fil_rev_8_21_14_0_10_41_48]|uniref:Uncharacterized protein n=1 Tax=Candidatus Taylorbacteria bacterium CG10_big_fil_rev_8_21_14_0_10_41_48 TaxID=1975024 RepID=A0A2M8LC98_9BACT|nr:MAG: hypothetical protein COV01_02000 [Candidatus Taylorbacteria bacterium CG10_big_fil_rev_8_21_14_0_10_41_48]
MHIKFTPDELEELFHAGADHLSDNGYSIDSQRTLDVFHRVIEGVVFLNKRYHKWWDSFLENDSVDVSVPGRDAFSIVIERFGLRHESLDSSISQSHGFSPRDEKNLAEVEALNTFWKVCIGELTDCPVRKMHV